jgi:hypothetical protein
MEAHLPFSFRLSLLTRQASGKTRELKQEHDMEFVGQIEPGWRSLRHQAKS